MSYQVLARQFRPQRFKDVMGQEAVITTLRHALAKKRLAQAYLFCGPRGTGKTTLARLLAKALNCLSLDAEGEPCNICSNCLEIATSTNLDVLEIDGASHRGIEDVRQINEAVHFAPTSGKYKVYLIDEVHMLTKEAFNALLKTLEEPPEHVKFFFATTEPHKLPATILSRCQRMNLMRLNEDQVVASLQLIASHLQLQVLEKEALELVARLSEGSLRDAQSIFDQLLAYGEGKITVLGARAALGLPEQAWLQRLDQAKGRYEVAFSLVQDLFASGRNFSHFLDELTYYFRQHLLAKRGLAPCPGHNVYREEQLIDILNRLQEAVMEMKIAPSERVYVEMVLLDIIRSHERISAQELVQRLEQLEQRLTTQEMKRPVSPSPVAHPTVSEAKVIAKRPEPSPKPPVVTPQPAKVPAPQPTKLTASQPVKIDTQARSRLDTLMRFAAKELNGTLKLE